MYFDYTWIHFPLLNLEFNPGRLISIGSMTIYFYGIIIAFGLMLAVVYGWRRAHAFGIKQDDLTDGILWIVPFAIICARAYYCIFKWEDYADNPISVFYIWKGGLAIYGGVIGAAVGTLIHCKIKKIHIPAALDLVALGFLIGQSIGRWGNFFNREAFGAETESIFRMGLWNTSTGEYEYHHPTFLYESVWNAIGFVILHKLSKKRKYDGQIALGYALWYGLGRAAIEGLRTDSLYMGPFRVSQLLAAVSCVTALVVLVIQSFRPHDPLDLFVNRVADMEAIRVEEEPEAEIPEEAAPEEAAPEAAAPEEDPEQ